MKSFLLILIPLVLSSCEMGYKNDGKEVTYHSWNEGTGHTFFRVKPDPATFEKIDFDGSWTVFDKNHIYEGKNSEKLQKYLKEKNKNNSR